MSITPRQRRMTTLVVNALVILLLLLLPIFSILTPQEALAQTGPTDTPPVQPDGGLYNVLLPLVQENPQSSGDPGGYAHIAGATATSSTTVRVAFSKPMSLDALESANYSVTFTVEDGSAQQLAVHDAWFVDSSQMTVVISTTTQSNVLYTVRAGTVHDRWNQPLAPPRAEGGILVDPAMATFSGIAPRDPLLPPEPPEATRLVGYKSLSNTTLQIAFNNMMSDDAEDPANYSITATDANSVPVNLPILSAVFHDPEADAELEPATATTGNAENANLRKMLILTTAPQAALAYTLKAHGVHDLWGRPLAPPRLENGIPIEPSIVIFIGTPPTPDPDVPDPDPPQPTFATRVVGAISVSNTQVRVTFNKQMGDSALDPLNYSISSPNSEGAPSYLKVTAAEFISATRMSVLLTTLAQSGRNYTLSAPAVLDYWGGTMGPKEIIAGVVVDPSTTTFVGTGPTSGTDSDGDGLSDAAEQAGYPIRIFLADGSSLTRHVTSDPTLADTDGDGIDDSTEKAYNIDPRSADTDGDQVTDYRELMHIYSDPARQDSDNDGYMDGLEYDFFFTSPLLDDTDGDQIKDGDEIVAGNRNPLAADLPKPAIAVSDITMRLDVRFTEETATGTRQLEARTVESTLTQSQSRGFSNMSSAAHTASANLGIKMGQEINTDPSKPGTKSSVSIEGEVGWSGTWTTENTTTSEQNTEKSYQESLNAEAEKTRGSTVTREVTGAQIQAVVYLRNASNIAFRLKNVQVTVFMQDRYDATLLTPVATLLPANEPENGFSLGPLARELGPFIFSNDSIFPSLVDSIFASPHGLVFRISNFDIEAEGGRNFAFSSQEVIERTGSIVIDRGSYDSDGDGEGDLTEYHRVATGTGRRIDTNGDGIIDDLDERAIYDENGKPVGITLRDALKTLGYVWYDEAEHPTSSLTAEQIAKSYSTLTFESPAGKDFEVIIRMGATTRQEGVRREWLVLTSSGWDPTLTLDEYILTAESEIKIVFAYDLDDDKIYGSVEYVNGCSDTNPDSDNDGLSDYLEVVTGWKVETSRGTLEARSRCNRVDSDGDGLTDRQEFTQTVISCPVIIPGVVPIPDARMPVSATTRVTDPSKRDTDGDGIPDNVETCGYEVILANGTPIFVQTDPTDHDTDDDGGPDGVERELGGNPTDPGDAANWTDTDRDGLYDGTETIGWTIEVESVSTLGSFPNRCNMACHNGAVTSYTVTSSPFLFDTDGDGLPDAVEREVGTDPRLRDTDGDGLSDYEEVYGYRVVRPAPDGRDLGIINSDPTDADTDNDGLSDGTEAELNTPPPANQWIVRVEHLVPVRVFSHPLFADSDLDGLVDGDERALGTHPEMYDTDGDRRNDALDSALRDDPDTPAARFNPLVQDFMVTVRYHSLLIDKIDDESVPADRYNDTEFVFQVRLPDGLGLADATTLLAVQNGIDLSLLNPPNPLLPICVEPGVPPPCYGALRLQMRQNVPFLIPVMVGTPESLNFTPLTRTFYLARNQSFALTGWVGEIYGIGTALQVTKALPFGYGSPIQGAIGGALKDTIFTGADLVAENKSVVEITYKIGPNAPDTPTGEVRASYTVR